MAIETVQLQTADGLTLESELHVPDDVHAAAVLAHPHPLHGGNMRSIVIGALFAGLPAAGVAVLRFNFRGVGASGGTHDGGRGERLDVVAALDVLEGLGRERPLVLGGWSFGADTSLAVGDERATAWFAVAPPLRRPAELVAARDPRPKLLAIPEHDQFRSPESARPILRDWESTSMEIVRGADHFLIGRTEKASDMCLSFLRSLCSP